MEHRNSTVVTGRALGNALSTASHEFFHCWNVERIRPQGLEPFTFEEANMTDSLWLAEGFTQYYGVLIMTRAGLLDPSQAVGQFGELASSIVNGSGRQFRSAVDMSRMAPFVDAARAVDRTNFNTTFISYYSYGGAIALGLDLTLRDRTGGKVTLDDFMRAMWRTYGAPGGPAPGLVGHPYSLTDVRDRLADVSGDRDFATDFVNRFIAGTEVVDYPRLFARAGVVWRPRAPGHAWLGDLRVDQQMKIAELVAPGIARVRGGPGAGRRDYGVEWEGHHDTAGVSGDPARGEAWRSDVDRVHPARRASHRDSGIERGSIRRRRADGRAVSGAEGRSRQVARVETVAATTSLPAPGSLLTSGSSS